MVVFASLEDKDRVLEGGPYFYATAGLYMQPWTMNFVQERKTFTLVLVWIRLYSLPLDYWLSESLKTIGNKLGNFIKISDATLKGKYTAFARICVEMDLSGALPDAIILEVYDEEWMQVVDYEHVPFRCRNAMNMGIYIETAQQTKWKKTSKSPQIKILRVSPRSQKNKLEKKGTNQEWGITPTEKARDTSMENMTENNQQKEDLPSSMEISRDHEMTPSEAGTEDHELQENLERENLDLEKFMEQGITKGVDSLPKEEFDRVQHLFL
eukprot:PITA_31990